LTVAEGLCGCLFSENPVQREERNEITYEPKKRGAVIRNAITDSSSEQRIVPDAFDGSAGMFQIPEESTRPLVRPGEKYSSEAGYSAPIGPVSRTEVLAIQLPYSMGR
jgi:hypothetical protein